MRQGELKYELDKLTHCSSSSRAALHSELHQSRHIICQDGTHAIGVVHSTYATHELKPSNEFSLEHCAHSQVKVSFCGTAVGQYKGA